MKTGEGREFRRGALRLAVQFGALIVVLFTVLGGVVFAVVNASQSESIQRILINTSKVDSPQDAPAGVFLVITSDQGTQSSQNLPPGLPDVDAMRNVTNTGRDVQQTKALGDHTYLIRTSAGNSRVTQVAVDLHESQEELQRLDVALIVSGIIAAISAALIAAWMARRAMRPLAEALTLQRRFVMDASHELRTPLTLLSTRAQLVRRRLPASGGNVPVEVVTHGLDEIVQDSRVLSEILEDLLIAADPRDMAEKARLDVAALADDAVGLLRSDAETRGITIRRTGSPDPVMVTAARVSMQRLFTALIVNALDHAHSRVDVDVTLRGRQATIRVVDDGPGFPEGMDEHAFTRFASSRPLNPENERHRHYGLGLALVSDVAARHGGGVSIETGAPGRGATVEVRLPVRP
ncbi:MAG: HAMP domain-containing sensor histidine kinase [Terrimesophilobacter sp.]